MKADSMDRIAVDSLHTYYAFENKLSTSELRAPGDRAKMYGT